MSVRASCVLVFTLDTVDTVETGSQVVSQCDGDRLDKLVININTLSPA